MGTLGLFCIWFLLLENYAEHVVSMEPGAVQSLHFPLFRNGLVEIIDARGLSTHRTLDPFVNNLPLETKFLAGKYPKTSIVAACKERLTQLRQVFQGWLSLRGLCQIILVDWSSSESLYRFVLDTIQQTPSKVQVTMVRVENARNWSLAQAYNLAVSFATGDWILKLDCDTWIDPLFLSKHPFQNDTFYSASVSSEGYLHGVFYMPREIFCRMGG